VEWSANPTCSQGDDDTVKHYLLSIQQPDGGPPSPAVLEPVMRDVEKFNRELKEAGAWAFAGGLEPPHLAHVARPAGGEVAVTEGPYLEGREHVGGMSVIRVHDTEEAIAWGRKLARATTLPVEIRGFQGEATDHLA
jgi:hypothetical protein